MAAGLFDLEQFSRLIEKGVALIDFNAECCEPCRAQDAIIAELNMQHTGIATIAAVNIDQNRDIAFSLGIQSIPTIIIFKDGREMKRFIGLQSMETLQHSLTQALGTLKHQQEKISTNG